MCKMYQLYTLMYFIVLCYRKDGTVYTEVCTLGNEL